MLRLTAAVLLLSLVSGLKCPDQQRCGDQQTCCQIPSGEFNCCPFHQGECCEDHLHCCPDGMLCEVKESRCTNATHSLPWAERFPSEDTDLANVERWSVSDVTCDETKTCPDGNTCCKNEEGGWACCPLPQAVCCEDLIHCCPHDTKCNVAAESCDNSSMSVPWLKKEPSKPIGGQKVPEDKRTSVSDVPCDDTVACPDDNTCCKNQQGVWACCPLPQAVCCADLIHCCPHGTKCSDAGDSCDNSSMSVPWLKKEPSKPIGGQKVPSTKDTSVSDIPCDDTKTCPDDNTCCKTEEGGYDCCPLPQAVCCEDFIHCCPHGTKCNLAAQKCDNSSMSVPLLEKEPSKPIGGQKVPEDKRTSVSDVPCDDTVACPDDNTCCKNQQGVWACCPLPQAVCCADLIHCCPHGTKCSDAGDSCDNSSMSVPWLKKEPSKPIGGQKVPEDKSTSVSDVPCDDTVACPDDNTCCKNQQGVWACCPLPQAVCCADLIHCCPHGTKCSDAGDSCDNSSMSVPWLKKEPSKPIGGQKVPNTKDTSVSDIPCDDTKTCPDDNTCCKTEEGGYDCCPLPQAVCCEDFIHCCPHGTKCNLAAQKCDNSSMSVPLLEKEPSKPIGGQKVPEDKSTSVSDVPCDDTVACPDDNTCCKNQQGVWACCPLPQAVCCADLIHCCPHGTKCSDAGDSCDNSSMSVPWLKKEPSKPIGGQKVPNTKDTSVSDIPCDDTKTCPDDNTCCKTEEGGYDCCPLPQAVCCEDFIHCCPHGTKCNLAAQKCDNSSMSVPLLEKEPSKPIGGQKVPEDKSTSVSDVPCDDTVACPDDNTCCKNQQGVWACCPLPQAVCCADLIHCCPHGTKCSDAGDSCDNSSMSVPWLKKEPSKPIGGQKVPNTKDTSVSDIPCDDTKTCPDDNTCCKTEEGGYDCCPLPQAVCCEDFIHCCPHGTKCNLAAQKCDNSSMSVPLLKKEPSKPIGGQKVPEDKSTSVSDVPCDDTVACPDDNTCCKNQQGVWACCPLPQAVCCADLIHCCPHGTKCSDAGDSCDNSSMSVPWLKKEPSKPIGGQKVPSTKDTSVSDIPCDDTKTCPDDNTCCKTEEGGYDCCPLPQAVCCEDFIHCCPHGTKCNLAAQKCDNSSMSVPLLEKEPSKPIGGQKVPEDKSASVSDVPCDDTAACLEGSTCCKNEQGGWVCCPLPQAVCCEDLIHCCPHDTKCNLAIRTCDSSSGSVPWLKKEQSKPIGGQKVPNTKDTSVSDIPCDDTKTCPDDSTCCKTEEGEWACCPLPQAVCCEDFIHCCPHGTKCNLAAQKCDNSSGSVPWLKKEPSKPIGDQKVPETEGSVPWLKKKPSRPTASTARNTSVNEVTCDPHVSCPPHTTCCFMKMSKKWGCCPLDQATCCDDGENCCPKGYTCRNQWCEKSSRTKYDSVPLSSQIQNDIDCGGGFSCKDTETCCKISESSWGCCPFTEAVCCSDMEHCCPTGYTCETGSCVQATGFKWEMFFSKKKRAGTL
ncbi:granulin a isoform X15 [Tachysurus fulvidraco]|uniref:granulin a isoform X15 n=1 Tax=Tachysurus fulvidraco TaxID=1234273 RepID=UPI001FEEE810|nr:granulin a isoform X15 [Tachysurus fulvidraco]